MSWHWCYLRLTLDPKRRSVIPSHESPTIPQSIFYPDFCHILRLSNGYSNKDHYILEPAAYQSPSFDNVARDQESLRRIRSKRVSPLYIFLPHGTFSARSIFTMSSVTKLNVFSLIESDEPHLTGSGIRRTWIDLIETQGRRQPLPISYCTLHTYEHRKFMR